MAVQHTQNPVFGLQFHPESIMTPDGKTIVQNFLFYADEYAKKE
jgi:anthranilate synthase component 2